MSFLTYAPLLLALGICFVPVWLLRHANRGGAQAYFVSSHATRPEVVRNASIAYALRMAAFGPLLAWGASGELVPALIGSASFGLGVYSIYVLREPLVEFVDEALRRNRSITVHEFISQQHGNDRRVRRLAASLTLFALLGLLVAEALAVAAVLDAALPAGSRMAYPLVLATILLAALNATGSGHSGVMHSAQLQLGMLYLGLFGSTALLLYLHLSALMSLPPQGTMAILFVGVFCALTLFYRRSKYVDTARIESAGTSRGARVLGRFGKILNIVISIAVVLVIVLAVMELLTARPSTLARDTAAALHGARVPYIGLVALCAASLLYPLVDVTNWQRLAALRKDASAGDAGPSRQAAALRSVFRIYAAESALVSVFICTLGAIAVIAIDPTGGADGLHSVVRRLVVDGNEVTVLLLPLLLLLVFMLALSTMSALFSASLCTLGYDVLESAMKPKGRRVTRLAAGGLTAAVAGALWGAETFLRISFASSAFLALLFAFCCAQLTFAPLVLGPVIGRRLGFSGTVSAGWALVILGVGAAGSAAAIIVYFVTGMEAWLWAAVPACLGPGIVMFVIARMSCRTQGGVE